LSDIIKRRRKSKNKQKNKERRKMVIGEGMTENMERKDG
jgi:hypothetical protein